MAFAELQSLEDYFNTCKLNHAILTNLSDLIREDDHFKSSFFQNVEELYNENKNQLNTFISQHYGLNKPLQAPTSRLDSSLIYGKLQHFLNFPAIF